SIFNPNSRLLNLRVTLEVAANKTTVPAPVVLAVTCRMYSDKAASGADITLKGLLLLSVEDRPRGVEEQYYPVLCEHGRRERRGVLGDIDLEAVFGTQGLERGDTSRD